MAHHKEKINLIIILACFFNTLCFGQVLAQKMPIQLVKKFDLQDGIAAQNKDIIINYKGEIVAANVYGFEIFNGVKWRRLPIHSNGKSLLTKRLITTDSGKTFYAIGKHKIAKISIKPNQTYFIEILVNKEDYQHILGGYVYDVALVNNNVIFLGHNGVIRYHLTSKKITHIKHRNIKKPIFYYKLNNQVFLKERDRNTLILNKDSWKTIKLDYIDKHVPQKVFELNDTKSLIIDQDGNCFFREKRNNIITKDTILSNTFKNSYFFDYKVRDSYLYIKSHNQIAVYDYQKQQLIFNKKFSSTRLNGFDIDFVGNIWLATTTGIYFLETNTVLTENHNKNNIIQRYYINKTIYDIKKNSVSLEIQNNTARKYYGNLGKIYNVLDLDSIAYICTASGLYKTTPSLEIRKVYKKTSYFILRHPIIKKLTYILGNQSIAIFDGSLKKGEIKILGKGIKGIFFNNAIYYSTTNKCYKINLNNKGLPIGDIKELKFPIKTFLGFNFLRRDENLLINNPFGIFTISQKDTTLLHLTNNIKGIKKSSQNKTLTYFSNIFPTNQNTLLVVPALGGDNNGENIPGYLIKNKEKSYTWYNKPFKRMGKYELLGITKTPRNTYEFITNDHIIEYDPNKKVNTDYAFKAYIRSAQVKTKQIDSTSNKETLVDSSIYYGNLATPPTVTLPYSRNTLTFTYASDSWAAYERNLYSYQLTGLDEGWSNWSTEQKKEYTHLREGRYTFKVRCKNVYGTISSVDSYTFTILPPWHRTTWAYALYILAGLALLIGGSYGYSRYRSRQLYKRNQHLEQVVTERTEEILAQKEEISQQADMLQNANNDLKQANEQIKLANEQIKKEKDEKVKIYLQEATEAANKLQQVRNTLAKDGSEEAQKILKRAISGVDEFVIIREKVRKEYPDFTERIDQALMDKKITKLVWQVGYCLKLGMLPAEVAEVLPTNNRSVSTHGSNLRRLGILEPIKKS